MYVALLLFCLVVYPGAKCGGEPLPKRIYKLTIIIIDFESKASTYDDYTYEGLYTTSVEKGATITQLVNVKPTATAFSTLSADTSVDDYYSEVTVVNVLVPTGVGEAITVRPSHPSPPSLP